VLCGTGDVCSGDGGCSCGGDVAVVAVVHHQLYAVYLGVRIAHAQFQERETEPG